MPTPTSPNSAASRVEYVNNKEKQYRSKVKNLLYGGDDRPETPQHHGKKTVVHNAGVGVPFATVDANTAAVNESLSQSKAYIAKGKSKEGAGKVGSNDFDPDVYRQSLVANHNNMAAQKARNWGSGLVMAKHPITPAEGSQQVDGEGEFQQHYA